MAENRARPINRRQAIRTALAAVFGATVGASVGGIGGGVDSDAFVRKSPSISQTIKSTSLDPAADDLVFVSRSNALDAFRIQREDTTNFESALYPNQYRSRLPDGSSEVIVPLVVEFLPSGTVVSALFYDYGGSPTGNREFVWGDDTQPDFLNTQRFILPKGLGSASRFLFQSDTFLLDAQSEDTSTGGAVGQPTGISGTASGIIRPSHRHAFSGRFLGAQATYPISANAGLPINIARIKINNNWTLRRIWVYTNTGPTGGTETYALVNAAGAVQGTAVVLPAGPGVAQAESALQVTNLTGTTLYYLAQTAVGAGWLAASGNVEVGFEYTMNI